MKKRIIQVSLFIAGLIIVAIGGIFITVNSSLLTVATQWPVQHYWLPEFKVKNVTYKYPFQFTLQHVKLTDHAPEILSIDIWINPYRSSWHKLDLDSVLIDGPTITDAEQFHFTLPSSISLSQLAIKNAFISGDNWSINRANLQIAKPQWRNQTQHLPFGEIQFQADNLQWHEQTFSNLLIDADYLQNDSVIYGLSFQWHHGDISLQAKEHDQNWDIVSAAINNLNVNVKTEDIVKPSQVLSELKYYITKIERLDVLNSNYISDDFTFSNLNLSAENVALSKDLWAQNQTTLSLSADAFIVDNNQWIDPKLKIQITPDKIDVLDFNTRFLDGYGDLSATITPTKTTVHSLNLQGMKYFIESDNDVINFPFLADYVHNLDIENASVQSSQIIQLYHHPYWQLSGINTSLKNAELIRDSQINFWSGDLDMAVNSVSYDGMIGHSSTLTLHRANNQVALEALSIKLKNGFINAHGKWDSTDSQEQGQWQLSSDLRGVPAKLAQPWLSPLKLDGILNAKLTLSGTSIDQKITQNSINGQLNLNVENGLFMLSHPQLTVVQPFSLPNLEAISHQGEIEIKPTQLNGFHLQGTVSGDINLMGNKKNSLKLAIKEQCQELVFHFLNQTTELHRQSRCKLTD